ncbi:MAG: hypothetical protein AABY22_34820 [Nanoarchaeota archaeon]
MKKNFKKYPNYGLPPSNHLIYKIKEWWFLYAIGGMSLLVVTLTLTVGLWVFPLSVIGGWIIFLLYLDHKGEIGSFLEEL